MKLSIKRTFYGILYPFVKYLGSYGIKIGVSYKYYNSRGKWPNLDNPQNLSEKILASMCRPDFLKFADLADKVKVRDYIKSKGLDFLLLEHYRVWDTPDDITLDNLPDKFILKPNNGSGGHVYCRDKDSFDLDKAKKTLKAALAMAKEYYLEPHYLKIEPKVYAEELLDLGEGKVLTDYKFHCIKGEIVAIFLAGENSKGERKFTTVDLDWNELPYTYDSWLLRPIPKKPSHLNDMIEYAKVLSKDFDYVRVDFYEYEGKVYFGELTFSPQGGLFYYYTDEALKILGEKL